jgi:acyl-CoA dehydrogenase
MNLSMSDLAITGPAATDDADDAAFVSEVRAFLAQTLTPQMQAAARATLGNYSEMEPGMAWYRKLYERGWIAPAWPKANGGAGWTVRQRFLFDRECALADAPTVFGVGLRSIGPLLIEMGTEAQKSRYLEAILRGDDLWCQGFSEPGAGSDLAAITCRADRDGDHYVINGTKIWTTGAHHANRMFGIFRSRQCPKKQQGMTFLLLDMDSLGLTVQPILGLAGEHEFNQIFFDNVRVPLENRVGEEDDGWTVAKRLMQLARSNNTPAVLVKKVLARTARAIAQLEPGYEPSLRTRLMALEIELTAFEQMELAALATGRPRPNDNTVPSVLKLTGSELHQRVSELAKDVAGQYAMAGLSAVGLNGAELDVGAHATAKYLAVRAATIYSGSSETQRNVVAAQLGF